MTNREVDFETWFSTLQVNLLDQQIDFKDADSVRDDYEQGRDMFDVYDEIVDEYE